MLRLKDTPARIVYQPCLGLQPHLPVDFYGTSLLRESWAFGLIIISIYFPYTSWCLALARVLAHQSPALLIWGQFALWISLLRHSALDCCLFIFLSNLYLFCKKTVRNQQNFKLKIYILLYSIFEESSLVRCQIISLFV